MDPALYPIQDTGEYRRKGEGSPSFMLQFALLLFYAAIIIYLLDLGISVGTATLVVTSVGLAFYTCIAVATIVRINFPFRTIFSAPPRLAKKLARLTRVRLRRRFAWIKQTIRRSDSLTGIFGVSVGGDTHTHHTARLAFGKRYPMLLSNPGF